MRNLILLVTTLLISSTSNASEVMYSDLSSFQRSKIEAGLTEFLPKYRQALEIALYNIERKAIGTMDIHAPMKNLKLENTTLNDLFETIEDFVGGNSMSLKGLKKMRGSQTMVQLRTESEQARKLAFHITANPWDKKAWMKHMNSQLIVVESSEMHASVRLRNFPRPNCTIYAHSTTIVHQYCD